MDREPSVALNELELVLGGLVGVMRGAVALTRGRRDRAQGIERGETFWERAVEGALGEVAAAKCLGLFWNGAAGDDYRATKGEGGDVGRLQVRLRIADYLDQEKRLIVQPRDSDDEDFLLVVGRRGSYRLVGWMNAGVAKSHPEWIANPGRFGEAWFVPQGALQLVRDVVTA